MMQHIGLVALLTLVPVPAVEDIPGVWDSPTATFDLRPLTKSSKSDLVYQITDGDIECTVEVEGTYTYAFNFFADVSYYSGLPSTCSNVGAAVQYGLSGDMCSNVGRYDPDFDDQIWSLYDTSSDADPSQGVTLTYLNGDACAGGVRRQLSLHVQCANHAYRVVHAQETSRCHYEITVESWYGCPTACPVTSGGLCDSHGLCMMEMNADTHAQPHCYCNKGFTGDDCSKHEKSSGGGNGSPEAVQIALLVILLVIFLGLVGVVIYMTWQVVKYRKETTDTYTAFTPMSESEIEM